MKLVPFYLLCLASLLANAQTNLTMKVNAPFYKDGTIISIYKVRPRRFEDIKPPKDSTVIKNHQFEFKLNTGNGDFYSLTIGKNSTRFYLQPGKANVVLADSTLNDVRVTDNQTNTEAVEYLKWIKSDSVSIKYLKGMKEYFTYMESKNLNPKVAKAKRRVFDSLSVLNNKRDAQLTLSWIKQHPKSYFNCYLLYSSYNHSPDSYSEAEVKSVFAAMPAEAKDNTWGRELKYRIDSLFVGAKAPAFTQADTNGKMVQLANFKGKYVLVDFWASWCVPCRAENPNVVKAAKQYGNRNFTVLGISLDDKKDLWLEAIKKDGLNWAQLSDLKHWRNAISVAYYVYAIPGNYLIGPDGTILAKNLHDEELFATLDKVLK